MHMLRILGALALLASLPIFAGCGGEGGGTPSVRIETNDPPRLNNRQRELLEDAARDQQQEQQQSAEQQQQQ